MKLPIPMRICSIPHVSFRCGNIRDISSSAKSLYSSKEGRNVSKIFKSVNGIDKKLLSDNIKTYPAELALFAVSSSCQGKGIGKMLFESALEHMKNVNLKEFYLFTDTSCNYGFYEHQGMKFPVLKMHSLICYDTKNSYSSLNPSPTTSLDSITTINAFLSTSFIIFLMIYICLLLQAHMTISLSCLV